MPGLALALVIGTTTVFATNAASAANASSDDTNYSNPSNSFAPAATAHPPLLEDPLVSSDNESVSNNTNSSNEEVDEINPADVQVNTADPTPAVSPKNISPESVVGEGAAPQPSNATNDDTGSQEPAPTDNDSSTQEPAPVSENTGKETDESSFYVFPVNKSGETYGSMSSCAQGQRAPDLTAAIGTEGQSGYIRRTEWERLPEPTTPEEAATYMEKLKTLPTEWTIPLYDQEALRNGE